MTYQYFAYFYDQLMDEAPYHQWVQFFKRQQEKYVQEAKQVLDLACGTGTISILLYEQGFHLTGVDLSEDMLAVAQAKCQQKGYPISFYQQTMTDVNGIGPFDIVVIFCDSLNYLLEEEEVFQTFSSVYRLLNDDGLLLFDVHSMYKINKWYPGKTFAYNGEDISYIWNCYSGEQENSVEHELTFFVYDEKSNRYQRYDEVHIERTFPIAKYEELLREAGFTVVAVEGDFYGGEVKEESERIFFTAQKKRR